MLELNLLHIALIILVLLVPVIPNLWAIWHIFHCDFPSTQEKMLWIAISVFLPILGGILYLIKGRKKAQRVI